MNAQGPRGPRMRDALAAGASVLADLSVSHAILGQNLLVGPANTAVAGGESWDQW